MKKLITVAFFTIILLAGSFAYAENPSKPIKIGLLTDLTNKAAFWGQQARLGAEIVVEELRAEGKDVEVIYSDHQLDTKKAVTAAQKLLYVDKVDAIYSNFTATSTAVAPIVANSKKLFVYSAAAQSIVKKYPNSFKTYLDYIEACKKVAEHWKERGIKKAGMLKATAEFGELCYQGARQIYPKITVVEFAYGDPVPTQVLLLKNKGVKAVLSTCYEGDTINMIKAMETINYEPLFAVNFDAVTPQIEKQYGTVLKRIITFGYPEISHEFIAKVKEYDPKNQLASLEAAAETYLHIRQLVEAISSCDKANLTCQEEQLEKASPSEMLEFQGWRNRIADFSIVLRTWKDGAKVVTK